MVMADIARLKARRSAELLRIVEALRVHNDLARRLDLVLSVPGIGERTALALIIRMPEIGQVSREEAAALAGLAPFDDDSGKHKGQRHIAGGRGRLRRSLYAAALPAAFRWNKALVALYARLTARGKAHNAALIACARKLLLYANTVVQRGTPWTEDRSSVNGCYGLYPPNHANFGLRPTFGWCIGKILARRRARENNGMGQVALERALGKRRRSLRPASGRSEFDSDLSNYLFECVSEAGPKTQVHPLAPKITFIRD